MTGAFTLVLFAAAILATVASGLPILAGIVAGFLILAGHGLLRGFSVKALLSMMGKGVASTWRIAIVLALIGMLTGSWRVSGTVARIVADAAGLVTPEWCLPAIFLLNAAMSTLLGTSFGTAATLGVVSMTLANAFGVDPILSGGAVLAGAYVGDRCSPVSTSAALVAVVTGTNLYSNLARMVRTGAAAFIASTILLVALGIFLPVSGGQASAEAAKLFEREFTLSPLAWIPAAVLVGLVLARVPIRWTMAASILSAAAAARILEDASWSAIGAALLTGHVCADAEVGRMMNGGGLASMVNVCAIILISSTYSGLLEGTGLVDCVRKAIPALARRVTPFGAILLTAIATSAVTCSQALAVMLTDELCKDVCPDRDRMASHLENTAIVASPLIPWSIAGAVPIASIGAPAACVIAAFYLWLLPLMNLIREAAWRR